MSYNQLTQEQRYQIYALLKMGHNQSEIASVICVHKSIVSREHQRNQGQRVCTVTASQNSFVNLKS